MSNNKQSSVDWLISQLQKSKDWHRVLNEISQMSSAKIDIIEQAKAMHKEEVMRAYNASYNGFGLFSDGYALAEIYYDQYYNSTFGGDNEQQ